MDFKNIDKTKLLNYAVWAVLIGGAGYFLFTRTKAYKQLKLNRLVKKYPGWEINNKKGGTPIYMYAKNFWALNEDGSKDIEYWLIYYNTGVFRIYTRGGKEIYVAGGKYLTPTTFKITKGFKANTIVSGKSISDTVSKILEQKIVNLPTK